MMAKTNWPFFLGFLILEASNVFSLVPPIVDGGGYRIERDGLCLTAVAPEGKNELGLVETVPWTNAMHQKWSVEIFGSDMTLTPSNNKENNVTYKLHPMMSSVNYNIRLEEEFSQFRIINKENKLCLTFGQFVTLGSCDSDFSLWTFFRTG